MGVNEKDNLFTFSSYCLWKPGRVFHFPFSVICILFCVTHILICVTYVFGFVQCIFFLLCKAYFLFCAAYIFRFLQRIFCFVQYIVHFVQQKYILLCKRDFEGQHHFLLIIKRCLIYLMHTEQSHIYNSTLINNF